MVECIRTVHLHSVEHSAAVLPKEVLCSTVPVVKCIRRVHLHHAASPPELGGVMVLSGAKNFGKPRPPSSGLCREPLLRT